MVHDNYELDTVKQAAKGQWKNILCSLSTVPAEHLDGRGYPCPVCREGTDRFNAGKDIDETGSCFCRQCKLGGDGFTVLQKMNGWDLHTTVTEVGRFLLAEAGQQPSKPANGEAKKKPGKLYPDAVGTVLRAIRAKLPAGVTVPDQPITYLYQNADRTPAGVVLRWDRSDGEKEIRPLSNSADGWICTAMPALRPLYRLPAVVAADTVYLVEGEKTVEAMESFGLVATTSAGGSNAAGKTDWSPLAGKHVVICRDHDSSGEKYRDNAARLISEQAASATIHVAELSECWPEIPVAGDAADWSEQFDSQSPAWFREQLEGITKPLRVEARDAPEDSPDAQQTDEWPDLISFDDPELLRLDTEILPDSIRAMVQ